MALQHTVGVLDSPAQHASLRIRGGVLRVFSDYWAFDLWRLPMFW